MTVDLNTFPLAVVRLFNDPKVAYVRTFNSGWVPNSYKWRAPGQGICYTRKAASILEPERIVITPFAYDRKRSYGKGPATVAYSSKHGWLKV